MKAAFSIISFHDYHHEAHVRYTPWHFFPRYLSKKDFLDPYKALEKFSQYQTFTQWKHTCKELLHHALSPTSINEFNNGIGILHIYTHLHKLIEATHLIAIRSDAEQPKPNHLK